MRVLVLGKGAREHAIVDKLVKSSEVDKVWCARGNAATAEIAGNVPMWAEDTEDIVKFCKENGVDVVIINPEVALTMGLPDVLKENGIYAFAPSFRAAQLELSKSFAKSLMRRYEIPVPEYGVFDDEQEAFEYIDTMSMPVVVKADGAEGGQGLIIARDEITAKLAVSVILKDRAFGDAGSRVVIEEFLQGVQVGILVFSDGENFVIGEDAVVYKRAMDGDRGPHTGGMGALSPSFMVDKADMLRIKDEIIAPLLEALKKEGTPYVGPMFLHVVVTERGPKVVDLNVRFNDPATQVILPRLKTDLGLIIRHCMEKRLDEIEIEWEDFVTVGVVTVSEGYPIKYRKGFKIKGLSLEEKDGSLIYLAAVKKDKDSYVTDGGRVVNVIGKGKNVAEARENAYRRLKEIYFDGMYYRKDIGEDIEKRQNV